MKNFIFYLVGAMLLFVSCQSDDVENDAAIYDQASKMEDALKNSKKIVFTSYEGEISTIPFGGECDFIVPGPNIPLQFLQTGSGNATHIGTYTFVNTACIGERGLEDFEGVLTTGNGDTILYGLVGIVCDKGSPVPCPGEKATFTYIINGGSGLFAEATGTITIKGIFVDEGEFEARGWAEFTYLSIP